MAIKPRPFKVKCKACGWQAKFEPTSDVITRAEDQLALSNTCPVCGSDQLVHTELKTPVEIVLSWFSKKDE